MLSDFLVTFEFQGGVGGSARVLYCNQLHRIRNSFVGIRPAVDSKEREAHLPFQEAVGSEGLQSERKGQTTS